MNDNRIAVTVVIPVYNSADRLCQCLDGLLAQTCADIEIICVNDGSTDDSLNILQKYEAIDRRVSIINQQNSGAGAARNVGIANANGEYIIFLDSDDVFEPEMLELMSAQMERTESDAALCLYDAFDAHSGEVVTDCWTAPSELLSSQAVFAPSDKCDCLFQLVQGWPWDKMFRTDFIRKHGLEYPRLPNSQDLVFIFQALALAERICVVKRVLVHRSMNRGASISNSRAKSVESPYNAVSMLLQRMENVGVLSLYHRSLYRFFMNFLLWHVMTLQGDAQKRSYELLRSEWSDALNFDQYPKDVYDPRDYAVYRRLLHTSYRRYIMVKRTKSVLKKILPPPINTFNREIERVIASIATLRGEIAADKRSDESARRELLDLCRMNSEEIKALIDSNRKLTEVIDEQQKCIDLLKSKLDKLS